VLTPPAGPGNAGALDVALLGAMVSGISLADATGLRAASSPLNRTKKSSDIFFAAASISREPICASLPPTLAFTV